MENVGLQALTFYYVKQILKMELVLFSPVITYFLNNSDDSAGKAKEFYISLTIFFYLFPLFCIPHLTNSRNPDRAGRLFADTPPCPPITNDPARQTSIPLKIHTHMHTQAQTHTHTSNHLSLFFSFIFFCTAVTHEHCILLTCSHPSPLTQACVELLQVWLAVVIVCSPPSPPLTKAPRARVQTMRCAAAEFWCSPVCW